MQTAPRPNASRNAHNTHSHTDNDNPCQSLVHRAEMRTPHTHQAPGTHAARLRDGARLRSRKLPTSTFVTHGYNRGNLQHVDMRQQYKILNLLQSALLCVLKLTNSFVQVEAIFATTVILAMHQYSLPVTMFLFALIAWFRVAFVGKVFISCDSCSLKASDCARRLEFMH
jgi:hypothetical protein